MGPAAGRIPAPKGLRWRWSRMLLILLGLAAAEGGTMILLDARAPLPLPAQVALDIGALLVVAVPLLYVFAYRPLLEQVRRVEEAKVRARRGETMLAEAQRIAGLGSWAFDVRAGTLAWSAETFRLFGRDPADGEPAFAEFIAAIHPEDRERVRASIAAAIAGGVSPWQADYRLVRPDGNVRHIREEAHALFDEQGRVWCRVGTAQDVTERTLAEEERRREEQLHRTLLALHESADRLGLGELTAFAVEEMLRLTGSAVGYLFLYDDAAERFTLCSWSRSAVAGCGIKDPATSYTLAQTGLWGEPVRRRCAVITNDFAAPHPGRRSLPAGHVPIARHLSLPIIFEGRIVAVAGVGNKADPYGPEDERQLTLFTRGLWEIVQRKRREEEIADYQRRLRWLLKRLSAAEEEERRRLADNLHGTIVQDLAAARLRLAELRVGEADLARGAQVDEVAGMLAAAIGSARAITYELASPLLHELGLEPALQWLAEETGRRHGLQAECEIGTAVALPAERRILLYQIARELMRNVVKHADARRLSVRLEPRAGGARLEVRDDGRGFEIAPRSGATEHGGFGLFSIRERLKEAGGSIAIERGAGGGSCVVVHLPGGPLPEGIPA